MTRVLCVHGIAKQLKGEETLLAEWTPALRDGLRRAGAPGSAALAELVPGDISCAFYGDVFRGSGRQLAVGDPYLTIEDATADDAALLLQWWRAAAECDPSVIAPDARVLSGTRSQVTAIVQRGLMALANSRFFAGVSERGMLFDLQQVRRYLTEPQVRAKIQDRLLRAITAQTRVLVAHSLGSVVAYEALMSHPEWPATTLITLGSPLGLKNLIFDRLTPAPEPFPRPGRPPARWPGSVTSWTNIAAEDDVIAANKNLKPLFGPDVKCFVIDNGAHAHNVAHYLTAEETGAAIARGLLGDAFVSRHES